MYADGSRLSTNQLYTAGCVPSNKRYGGGRLAVRLGRDYGVSPRPKRVGETATGCCLEATECGRHPTEDGAPALPPRAC